MLLIIRDIDSEILHEDNVFSVKLQTPNGLIEILHDHAPMVGVIDIGKIIYTINEKEKTIDAPKGGIFSVENNVVTVLFSLHEF